MANLYTHQAELLKSNPDKTYLIWETGTGKTLTAIEWANIKNEDTIVICPKALVTNWKRNIWKHGITANFTILSKEEFKRDWETLRGVKTIIIDEAHYFSGKSQMTKALSKYIKKHKVPFILGLTATPFMSTPMNVLTLGQHVGMPDKNKYVWSYPYFMQEFFTIVHMGMRSVPVLKKNSEVKLAKLIQQMGSVVKLEDCVDVPQNNLSVEYFKLTKSQEKAIEAITDINYIVRWTKKHQICGGTLKGDEYNASQYFKSEKLDRLLEIIEEKKKTIIVCRYNHEIEMLAKELIKTKKVFIIQGDVKDKQAVLDLANKEPDCVLLVNAACSEGWEAPTFDTIVFYSYDFSLKNYIQMKGRIQRINALQKCNYISLVVADTIDEDVYKSVVEKKQSFHLKIYEDERA